MVENILFDKFQIKAIINSIADFDVVDIVPYGSFRSEINYLVLFNYKGHNFVKSVGFFDADFIPVKPSINQYTDLISRILSKEVSNIEETFFSSLKLKSYFDDLHSGVFHYLTTYVDLFNRINNFNLKNSNLLGSREFFMFLKSRYDSGLSVAEIFNLALNEFGISTDSILEYSNRFDVKMLK